MMLIKEPNQISSDDSMVYLPINAKNVRTHNLTIHNFNVYVDQYIYLISTNVKIYIHHIKTHINKKYLIELFNLLPLVHNYHFIKDSKKLFQRNLHRKL